MQVRARLSVHDLLSKKNLTVKVTSDSQLRQLPAEMAQRIAARLKGGANAGWSNTCLNAEWVTGCGRANRDFWPDSSRTSRSGSRS